MQRINIRIGDSSVVLTEMEPESVWAVVCDPPYDLVAQSSGSGGFMGKQWDSTGMLPPLSHRYTQKVNKKFYRCVCGYSLNPYTPDPTSVELFHT